MVNVTLRPTHDALNAPSLVQGGGDSTPNQADTSGSSTSSSPASSLNNGGLRYAASPVIAATAIGAGIGDMKCFPLDLDLVKALKDHPGMLLPREIEPGLTVDALQTVSRNSREHLMELTVSRTGRELQRWEYAVAVDGDIVKTLPKMEDRPLNCRLTTGCIPILPGGRILLISSSKSQEVFVLPKGGWEQDESLPLSALRETLEEAGVTGLLGPPLPALTYETKKAVKRRLSLEKATASVAKTPPHGPRNVIVTIESPVSTNHTHNRLVIFPLYVQSIYDHWPEENRLRRAVTVEEAADLLQHRPEFSHMLRILRERDLHRLTAADSM